MALIIKSDEFWGEFYYKEERYRIRLGVPVAGARPATLKLPGDPAFERSRARALVEFEKAKEEFVNPKKAADRLERIHELVTGTQVFVVKTQDLFSVWKNARRKKSTLAARHIDNVEATIKRFNEFLSKSHPKVDDSRGVTRAIADGFMESEERRGITNKTYNNSLITMRAVFNAAGIASDTQHNPFKTIPKKEDQVIHRKPFSQDELKNITTAALEDDLVGPVIITAICTGLRREDCALLRWSAVNLMGGTIQTKATKTDAPLFLPILLPLKQALEKQKKETEYCFPAAAALFKKNPDGLNDLLGKLLRKAGIAEEEIASTGPRLRCPSSEGFHRFKTTFVSLALDLGVPMAVLQKLVGNEVVELVIDTYYQPNKDAVVATIMGKFPEFLTGVKKEEPSKVIQEALSVLEGLNDQNWKEHAARATALIRKVAELITPANAGGTLGGTTAKSR